MLQFFKNNLDSLNVIEQTNCIRVYEMHPYTSVTGSKKYLLTFMPDMDMMLAKGVSIPAFDFVLQFSIEVLSDEELSIDDFQKRIDDEMKHREKMNEMGSQFASLDRFKTSVDKPYSNHKSFINYNKKEA